MAKFYFNRQIGVKGENECLHVESLNDIEKYFSKDNWIHRHYINNLYVEVLKTKNEFKYEVFANIFKNKMLNHFIGFSDTMLEYKRYSG